MASGIKMTGKELEKLLADRHITKTDLAKRWNVHRTTVLRLCKAEEVPQPYLDAVLYLAIEEHLIGLGFDVAKSVKRRRKQ